MYSISIDRVNYRSELRLIDNPFAKTPIVLSTLSDHILEALEPNKTNEMNKNLSDISPDIYSAIELNTKAVSEFIAKLNADGLFDRLTAAIEEETRKVEEKRKDILDKLTKLDARFSASLTIVVACVGFSSFLIAALNLILKYHRSFSYLVIDSAKSNEGTEKTLVLINNHDKAETILSVSFVANRKLYKLNLDLHSYMTPPLSLAAFGHLKIALPDVAVQQMNSHSDSCKLLIRTGDDAVSRGVNISRVKAKTLQYG
ncbi:MAG: hypothetical protein HWE27_05325 [Gammaproteobacteria bacterium]|nr:hypothetical protein [Gammaproteobacteria bacterium]